MVASGSHSCAEPLIGKPLIENQEHWFQLAQGRTLRQLKALGPPPCLRNADRARKLTIFLHVTVLLGFFVAWLYHNAWPLVAPWRLAEVHGTAVPARWPLGVRLSLHADDARTLEHLAPPALRLELATQLRLELSRLGAADAARGCEHAWTVETHGVVGGAGSLRGARAQPSRGGRPAPLVHVALRLHRAEREERGSARRCGAPELSSRSRDGAAQLVAADALGIAGCALNGSLLPLAQLLHEQVSSRGCALSGREDVWRPPRAASLLLLQRELKRELPPETRAARRAAVWAALRHAQAFLDAAWPVEPPLIQADTVHEASVPWAAAEAEAGLGSQVTDSAAKWLFRCGGAADATGCVAPAPFVPPSPGPAPPLLLLLFASSAQEPRPELRTRDGARARPPTAPSAPAAPTPGPTAAPTYPRPQPRFPRQARCCRRMRPSCSPAWAGSRSTETTRPRGRRPTRRRRARRG